MHRFARHNFSARLCILGLNPDASQPTAHFPRPTARLSDQTFLAQSFRSILKFVSGYGSGAIDATHSAMEHFYFQVLHCEFQPVYVSWVIT